MRGRIKYLILFVVCGALIFSCLIRSFDKEYYLGGMIETELSFSQSIKHSNQPNFYYEELFGYKYAGNISDNKEVQGEYNWLRQPKNLIIAFNTASVVGLDKLISKELYFSKEEHFYSGIWENMSLNEIVIQFLNSDTARDNEEQNYFTLFWERRRAEGNLQELHFILNQINKYYNHGIKQKFEVVNDTLKNLLFFDNLITTSDSTMFKKSVHEYFNYLKSMKMYHSAYDLAYYNYAINTYNIRLNSDSLIATLDLDTVSFEESNIYQTRWIDYNSIYEGP